MKIPPLGGAVYAVSTLLKLLFASNQRLTTNYFSKCKPLYLIVFSVLSLPPYATASGPHDEHGSSEEPLELTRQEAASAEISIEYVAVQQVSEVLRLPGEVTVNSYQTAKVTPRIDSQVVARHVRLGDSVSKGQPMVSLSSVEMADAQGILIMADRERKRLETLGSDIATESRLLDAQVSQQKAYAKALAYGMTKDQIEMLVKDGNVSAATGQFDLLAPQAGTVIFDEFVVGELIEPGRVLFEITDESMVWVEAQATGGVTHQFSDNPDVRVSLDGDNWIPASLVQEHHRLEERTRTRSMRLEVQNPSEILHPGQFVQVTISKTTSAEVLAIPSEAIIMMQGTWVVFVFDDDHGFEPREVELIESTSEWIAIQSGLEVGEEIATSNVFYLKSLLLKSSMGEGHAH
jgi:cobalt-zinc-cadmium efflux system membrane fusion protein